MGPHSSKGRARRGLLALGLAVLVGSTGCGGSGASPPRPSEPGVPRGSSTGRASAGEPVPAKAGEESTHPLDPSEVITPEELASIPEPLPGASTPLKGPADQPMDRMAQPPPEEPSGASQPPEATSPEPAPGAPAWRVQIYASDRREEAERVRVEASRALSLPGAVVREGALYKVRVGRFATEAEAQALRERAIQAGYPGAFRIKTTY